MLAGIQSNTKDHTNGISAVISHHPAARMCFSQLCTCPHQRKHHWSVCLALLKCISAFVASSGSSAQTLRAT